MMRLKFLRFKILKTTELKYAKNEKLQNYHLKSCSLKINFQKICDAQ